MSAASSYASAAKIIVAHVAPTLKAAGFRKRRYSWNRRLENGLIHEFSLNLLSTAPGIRSKYYFHAGCYVPAAYLWMGTAENPNWITQVHCCFRNHFVKETKSRTVYLDTVLHANDLSRADPYVNLALSALERVNTYEQIMSEEHDISPLNLFAQREIIQCCIALDRGEHKQASGILANYLAAARKKDRSQGHVRHVEEWGIEQGLF